MIALVCAALTACGGGGFYEPSPSEKLASAEFSSAATPLSVPQPQIVPVRFAAAASPAAASTAVFDWAQTAYPSFFPGAYVEGYAYVSDYGNFFYRHYDASGNYLGVLNGYLYVYGPASDWLVTPVGPLNDFSCAISGCTPLRANALTALAAPATAQPIQLSGDGITMTTFPSAGGAFCSLKWKGREFLDANDHGRCLQSASSYDGLGEWFNPTEAGSSADGTLSNPSTSVLMSATFTANSLSALTQMAYWNPVSGKALSAHTVSRDVSISDGIISYRVAFTVPEQETHTTATFEVLTGYMPAGMVFYTYQDGVLAPLSDGPGEQEKPIIAATPDGAYAMGIWSPDLKLPLNLPGGYGRWRFGAPHNVTKWNMVRRVIPAAGATYTYQTYITVGTLQDVQAKLAANAAR
ncbi:MAG TPA: hypothetical protein VN649_04840 [Ramlibacter sp.]|nr:hypothetical protein [Ramlibacter sp.]